jgi:hypothetical protein
VVDTDHQGIHAQSLAEPGQALVPAGVDAGQFPASSRSAQANCVAGDVEPTGDVQYVRGGVEAPSGLAPIGWSQIG